MRGPSVDACKARTARTVAGTVTGALTTASDRTEETDAALSIRVAVAVGVGNAGRTEGVLGVAIRTLVVGAMSIRSATTFPGGTHAALLGRRAITIGHTLHALVARQANAAAGAIGVGAALNAHASYANWSWATTILVVVAVHAVACAVIDHAGVARHFPNLGSSAGA